MIRLIATDLDDTLLDAGSDITPRTMQTLRRAMDAGVMISLSSGRMLEAMVPFAERIGVNAPMILYNGAMLYDHRTDRTIAAHTIPREIALGVIRMAEDMGLYIQAYPGKNYYCNRRCEHTEKYEKSIRVPCTELGAPLSQWANSDMIKMLIIDTPAGIDDAQAKLRRAFPDGVQFMKSKPHYLEIVAGGIDKGEALKALGETLGVAREEIAAFGDGQNDVSMLQYAGRGYAMENASAEVRASAAFTAPRNTEDGVAQVIEQFLAEGEIGRS